MNRHTTLDIEVGPGSCSGWNSNWDQQRFHLDSCNMCQNTVNRISLDWVAHESLPERHIKNRMNLFLNHCKNRWKKNNYLTKCMKLSIFTMNQCYHITSEFLLFQLNSFTAFFSFNKQILRSEQRGFSTFWYETIVLNEFTIILFIPYDSWPLRVANYLA